MPIAVLRPISTVAAGSWAASGAATIHECIDDPYGSPDSGTTEAQASGTTQFRCGLSSLPTNVLKINTATVVWFGRGDLAGVGQQLRAYLTLGGVDYDDGFKNVDGVGGAYLAFSKQYSSHPDGVSGELTPAHFSGAQVGGDFQDTTGPTDSAAITQLLVVVDYVAVPERIGATRFQASSELNLFRRVQAVIEVPAPERYGDIPIGQPVDLTHIALPSTETVRGRKPWQRTHAIKLGERFDPNNHAAPLVMRLLVMRWVRVTFWDTMETELAPSAFADGVARLDSGVARTFDRASDIYVENPAAALQGSVQVVKLSADIEALTTGGTLIEAAGTNECIRSSAVGGVETGWTSAGEGSNGSAIGLSTEQLLYTTDITPNVWKFTSGSPIHVADLQITGTVTAAWADGTVGCASFDVYDVSAAAPLFYQVIRDVGGTPNYWRDSDSTWQAGATWNAMVGQVGWHRHATKPMNIGTNTPDATLQIRVGVPTASGVAGQVNYLAHVQLEKNPYPTSRIPTVAATVTRALADLRLSNNHGKRIYTSEPEEPLTGFLEFKAEWNSTDLAAGAVREVFQAMYSGTNLIRLIYQQSTGTLRFRHRVAGVNYDAVFTTAITRGTWYKVAFRVISTEQEYGLAAYTLSVFVNGVKGTDVVAAAFGGVPSESTMYVGQSDSQTNQLDGILRRVRIYPEALSDDEVAGDSAA